MRITDHVNTLRAVMFLTLAQLCLGADGTPPLTLLQLAFPGVPASELVERRAKDYSPLTLVWAQTHGNPNGVEVTFSLPVDPASATNATNYTIVPAVAITSAHLGANAYTVLLTTATLSDAMPHTLTATNIQDSSLKYSITPSLLRLLKAQGVLTRRLFTGIAGAAVSNLTSAAKFPDAPDAVDFPAAFEATANAGDNYGLQFAGYVHPPATGDYAFFIAADEQAALYLSPDDSPAGKTLIATVPSPTAARAYTTLTNQRSAYVRLEAGHAYYIEALLKESTGSDHLAVTWRLRGMSAPATGDGPIPGAFLSSLTPSAPVSITGQPQPQTVAERAPATFTVTPIGTPPYAYQWLKNGAPIPGATASSYTIASAPYSFNGLAFSVIVSNGFSSAVSTIALLTVTPDSTPPTIVRLDGSATLDRVFISFSEPVTSATANNSDNYAFTGGLTVLDARLQPSGTNVELLTSPQTPGATYTLTATGVTDTFAQRNTAPTSAGFTAWMSSRGFLRREVFSGLSGSAVADLVDNARFPDSPDQSGYLPQFEAPSNVADNYGQRLFGWLLPPTTGFYRFFLSSDDDSALLLSTDDNPANATTVATLATDTASSGNWAAAAQTSPIWLEAGRSYYVEAQMKESTGNDHLAVAWQLPGGLAPTNGAPPIDGTYLATFANPVGVSLVTTQQPVNVTVLESSVTNFSVSVTSSYSPAFYQWQKNGADISGANGPSYTTPRLFRADDGARFRCFVSIPGTNLVSLEAIVTVTPDNTPPQALSAATLTGSDTVGLCFSELLDPTTATNAANYTLSTGGQVLRATLRPDGQTVALTVATLSFTNFTATVSGVKDLAGNAVAANTAVEVQVANMEASDVGIPGVDPLERGSTVTCHVGDYDVVAGGSDVWKAGQFVAETRDGDFDVRVRVARLDNRNQYSIAGLMVKETLAPDSRVAMAWVMTPTGYNSYGAGYRAQPGATPVNWPAPSFSPGVPLPDAWIRLQRQGDVFTAFRSTDGLNWTQYSQVTFPLPNVLLVGVASTSYNNSAGQVTTAWFRDYSSIGAVVHPIPLDLLIKKAIDPASSFSLDGIYQTTPHGAQNLWQTATSNAPAAYHVQVQNDGTNTLSPVVKATETAETGWTVTYRVAGQDITAQIRGTNGYTVTNLVAGTPETITVEFLPGSRVLGGTPKSATLSVFTDRYTTSLRDTVKAIAIAEANHQPDLMVRRLTDVIYRGKGVFNADGTGQTKTLELDYRMTGVYPIQLVNAGNVTNFFTLRGTAGGAGWTVRYLDAVSAGADITAEMNGGGTIVALPPAASWEGRVEVTFDATVPRGASNEILVTASAISDGLSAIDSPIDTVKTITTVMTTSDVPLAGLFTTDADFENGTLAGLEYGGDQLQLGQAPVTLPFIWIPNSNEGSVSKVDTRTGKEIARYRTGPPGVAASPSRTTVDLFGNCWICNRSSGTVVKIGLYENGQFVDRNGNGVIETSQDLNGDGDITGNELLPWGQDECVLHEVVLIPGREGTFVPGTYAGGYMNYNNAGPRAIAADARGNVWAGHYTARTYYLIEGLTGRLLRTNDISSVNHTPYGAVIDAQGILWSSGHDKANVLRLNPADDSFSILSPGHNVYGMVVDRENHLFISGWDPARLTRINVLTAQVDWTQVSVGWVSAGLAVGDDGDIWMANYGASLVTRWSREGVLKASIPFSGNTRGVATDAAGKVWLLVDGDENIRRIDPATDTVDLTKRIIGDNLHYGYSDMTGLIARNATTRFGTWTVRHNSKVEFTPWNALTWHGTNLLVTNIVGSVTNVFTNLTVRVRSSNDQQQWSGWERVESGYPLATTPAGQYLEIEVTLQQLSQEGSPVLYDILANPMPQGSADLEVQQVFSPNPTYTWWPLTNQITVVNHGPDDASGLVLTSSLPAGFTFLSANSTQGSLVQSNGLLRWNLGSLANGASLQAQAVVMATNTGVLTNFTGVKAFDTDPKTDDNWSSLGVTVMQAPCLAPPLGLVGWWPGDGTANDLVGTNQGAVVGDLTYVMSQAGLAFHLNGINASVRIPASTNLDVGKAGGLTMEAWIKPSDISTLRPLFEWERGSYGWGVHLWVSVSSAGSLYINLADTGGGNHVFSTPPQVVVTGQWQHIAFTYDKQTGVGIFLRNGTNVGSQVLGSFTPQTSSDLYLGYRSSPVYRYAGAMDEVAIYNRALTFAEIQAIYLAGSGGKCKGPVDVQLTMVPAPPGVVLRWPSSAAGWQLQSVDAPGTGVVWQPESTPPLLTNSQYQLLLPATNAQRFYRLKAP